MYSYGPPHMAMQKQDDLHEHIFSSYVRIRDVVLKTCLGWWTIGRSGERGSGISVLPARHDDDDDIYSVVHQDSKVKVHYSVDSLYFVDYHCLVFWLGFGDLFVSQNPKDLCASHSSELILGCEYTTCLYGQIWISCIFPGRSPSSPSHV